MGDITKPKRIRIKTRAQKDTENARARIRYAIDPTKKARSRDKWRTKNADRQRELSRLQGVRFRVANPASARASQARYRTRNPEKFSIKQATRRARKRLTAVLLTPAEKFIIEMVYEQARMMTELTGTEYQVDHKMPLARGGAHHPLNLQILTARQNQSKGAYLP